MTTGDNTRSPRRSRDFWLEHTNQWKQSGLSKIAYSKEHNLKPISFYNWSKKLEHAESDIQPATESPSTFVPVQIDHTIMSLRDNTQFVHVERAATDVALPVDLSAEQIEHWLQAIHALHV